MTSSQIRPLAVLVRGVAWSVLEGLGRATECLRFR